MIHYRKTVQIAPGRQAEAVARSHEAGAIYKQATGIDVRVSVVTTGTLGRLCWSSDYESMVAKEAADAKSNTHPDWKAFMAKHTQVMRTGDHPFIEPSHDEIWRDA